MWDNQTGTELKYLANNDKPFTWQFAALYLISPMKFTCQFCEDQAVYSEFYWKMNTLDLMTADTTEMYGNAHKDLFGIDHKLITKRKYVK